MASRFQTLPKIELHLHLDCSLSSSVVRQIEGDLTQEEYMRRFVVSEEAKGLPDYLQRALEGIRLMQTPERIRLVTLDLMEQLRDDQVLYAELRFAPLEHTLQGLHPAQVVEIAMAALREGMEQTGVEARLILCTLRHYSAEQSMATAQLAVDFSTSLVVGFDLAADEAAHGLEAHIPAFDFARAHGISCTSHAGEALGAESVWDTLNLLQPRRIGHGVRSIEDPTLIERLSAQRIHLEVCPTSNICTRVFPSLKAHSVDALFAAGVSLGINTDGRTISHVTLTQEYQKLHDTFGWTEAHFRQCNLHALEAAFLPEEQKAALKTRLLAS